MSSKNKFGFAPLDTPAPTKRRTRAPGPMGAAVRDAAENLQETTEAKVEQRRRNAEDAKRLRAAEDQGLLLMRLPVGNIRTDDLPRDRMELELVAQSDEMEELKASIRERGQKEPIEVYVDANGHYQLKKGWRRLTALTQLLGESGDEAFAEVVARVEKGQGDRIARYVDMVEENVIRDGLTFAEMAQVAILAAQDDGVDETDPAELVNRLYGALHKTKRSYIRSFVFLMTNLGGSLKWPREVARNLGVDVARNLSNLDEANALATRLEGCSSADEQNRVLLAFVASKKSDGAAKEAKPAPKQKFEFFVGDTKVTAREGEFRIVSERNYSTISKSILEDAVKAFEDALTGPRVR